MKLVGQGVQSCVIQPPYSCDTEKIPKNSVSKILTREKAIEEENKYKIVHSYDPKRIFSPKNVFRCEISKPTRDVLHDLNKLRCTTFKNKRHKVYSLEQIVMTKHGIPLHKTNLSSFYKDINTCETYIVREIRRLLYCASVLRSHKYSHMDLHSGNILVDKTTGKLTVIDFGELTKDINIYSYIRDRKFTKRDYTQFPPETVIISTILSTDTREETGSEIKNMSSDIVRLLQHGYTTGRLAGELVGVLKKTKYLSCLSDIMDPTNFPSISRDNLYSLRCGALLSLRNILKQGKSFSYACALSFVTIDSYAIGEIIKTILKHVILNDPVFYSKSILRDINTKIYKLTNTNINERTSARSVLIDINKLRLIKVR
jgi:serine/threonine protein kinase